MTTKKALKSRKARTATAKPLRAATGSTHIDDLYNAVIRYVEAGGGKLVVIGGINVQEWPADNEQVFWVAVKCMGRKPTFVAPNVELRHGEEAT